MRTNPETPAILRGFAVPSSATAADIHSRSSACTRQTRHIPGDGEYRAPSRSTTPGCLEHYTRRLQARSMAAPTARGTPSGLTANLDDPTNLSARFGSILEPGAKKAMTAADKVPWLEAYWEGLEPHLPHFLPEEQRVAVALYHELAKGRAVDTEQLGFALGISSDDARTLLDREPIKNFIYPDDLGRVLGFGGLAAAPMHHRFEVDGRMLSTWCAWDSLVIP